MKGTRLRPIISMLLLMSFSAVGNSQTDLKHYVGSWSGKLMEVDAFSFLLKLESLNSESYKLEFRGKEGITTILLTDQGEFFSGEIEDHIKVKLSNKGGQPLVFFKVGNQLCYIDFKEAGESKWSAEWNLLLKERNDANFMLSLDLQQDSSFYVSTFFKEPTFHYLFGQNFTYGDGQFSFLDIRSTIKFYGELGADKINLELQFLDEHCSIVLSRLAYDDWNLGLAAAKDDLNMGALVPNSKFDRLRADIVNDTLERTHGVVVAQNNKVIYEEYFDGFSEVISHDTRSAAKSIAGTMMGIAIADGFFENENQKIKPFYENRYPDLDWSEGKSDITLHHLLTMSSGLDAIDFGLNRNSFANENTFRNQEDWTKHILKAPMVKKVGSEGNYGSGSPHLLGDLLAAQTHEPLEFYIHRKLMQPLSIVDYRIQTTNEGIPYFGGGWYFTPKDLVKFGQLYLDEGVRDGQQIIPADWVKKSLQAHVTLENAFDKNKYSYLFWHRTYELGPWKIASIEGRGTGGQYFFIIPELNAVVAIMSGNYFNGKGFQPERIMQEYILKALVKDR